MITNKQERGQRIAEEERRTWDQARARREFHDSIDATRRTLLHINRELAELLDRERKLHNDLDERIQRHNGFKGLDPRYKVLRDNQVDKLSVLVDNQAIVVSALSEVAEDSEDLLETLESMVVKADEETS